jgi:hypothetical protein
MPLSHLLSQGLMSGWDTEQYLRLSWIKENYPEYHSIILEGDIDKSILHHSSSDCFDPNSLSGNRASIWINGHRVGSLEYIQQREFSKIVAVFYKGFDWASGIFLDTYPYFKKNMGKYVWVRRN